MLSSLADSQAGRPLPKLILLSLKGGENMSNKIPSGFEDMFKRFEMMNTEKYKTDYSNLINHIREFFATYSITGIKAVNIKDNLRVSLTYDEPGAAQLENEEF